MLSTSFVASTSPSPSPHPNPTVAADASILHFSHRPHVAALQTFKKSASRPAALAVTESHIFAAQNGKAVLHVYGREQGNHEAVVPFHEEVTAVAVACQECVVVAGTASGKIIFWEITTGRTTTLPAAHLKSVTSLSVDPPSHFLLSASADSTVHSWSIPNTLSISRPTHTPPRPEHTLTEHHASVVAVAAAHASAPTSNFCVSVSDEKPALVIVWAYATGTILHTVLLPSCAAPPSPGALCIDPANRAAWLACRDGGVQLVEFYDHNSTSATTTTAPRGSHVSDSPANAIGAARQLPKSSYFPAPDFSPAATNPGPRPEADSALSILLSWDTAQILVGHASGRIVARDAWSGTVGEAGVVAVLGGEVSNLVAGATRGFKLEEAKRRSGVRVKNVVRPRWDRGAESGFVFVGELGGGGMPGGDAGWGDVGFAEEDMWDGVRELEAWIAAGGARGQGKELNGTKETENEEFISLDTGSTPVTLSMDERLREENDLLKKQVASLKNLQRESFRVISGLRAEISDKG